MTKPVRAGLLALALATWGLADTQFTARRMTRSDVPLGKGQCDIRLQVDGEAEISVRGSQVLIRTISGRDPRDDGSECNEPLPARDIQNFNYEVRESRGDIVLLSEPGPRNGYRAIVRVRDSKSGEGRYHFRLTWQMTGADSRPDRFGRQDWRGDRGGGPGYGGSREIRFSGRGDGSYQRGSFRPVRLGGARIQVDQGGRARAWFDAEDGRPVAFAGSFVRNEGDALVCDMAEEASGGARGRMYISGDGRGNVSRVTLDGNAGRDRVRLDWRR